MLELLCHCGDVRVRIVKVPDYINACNCTLCRKTGARWGYFNPAEVNIDGAASGYRRPDKDDPGAEVRFCARCGSTTHFVLTESAVARFGDVMLGVNMRLADERDLAGVEVRYPDGLAWSGEGEFGHVRLARIIGQRAPAE